MEYSELREIWDEEEYDKLVEDGDWIDEGKRSYRSSVMQIGEKYYDVQECRSGSYFTDYYYEEPEIKEVEPYTETITVTRWRLKK